MNYVDIQIKESAHSRVPDGCSRNEYGERAIKNAKQFMPFTYGKVLVVGCGDGLEMEPFVEAGREVVGVDLSPEKVRIAKEHGLDVIEGRMEMLPFQDKAFNCIYCAHALEHAEDLEKAVNELQRVSGRQIVIVPIEPEGTTNIAHTSSFSSREEVKKFFKGRVMYEQNLKTIENEYVVIINAADF